MQFKDTICAKVLDISSKFVKYQVQFAGDSSEYVVKRNEVLQIQYPNDSIVKISKNRWDNFFRPAVNFAIGNYGNDEKSDEYYLETISFGIGHNGVFRLPIKGFGIVYNANLRFGKYDYYKTHDSLNTYTSHGPFYTLDLSMGLEYRYSFFRGFGMFGDVQLGKSYLNFYKMPQTFHTDGLIYSVSAGIYVKRVQLGFKYIWGDLVRQQEKADYTFGSVSHINLSIPNIFIAFYF